MRNIKPRLDFSYRNSFGNKGEEKRNCLFFKGNNWDHSEEPCFSAEFLSFLDNFIKSLVKFCTQISEKTRVTGNLTKYEFSWKITDWTCSTFLVKFFSWKWTYLNVWRGSENKRTFTVNEHHQIQLFKKVHTSYRFNMGIFPENSSQGIFEKLFWSRSLHILADRTTEINVCNFTILYCTFTYFWRLFNSFRLWGAKFMDGYGIFFEIHPLLQ